MHRNVKPANALYRVSGEALLGDLGLVRDWRQDATRLTHAGDLAGTIPYIAPEVSVDASPTSSPQTSATSILSAPITSLLLDPSSFFHHAQARETVLPSAVW